MRVSVIIPAINEAAHIAKATRSAVEAGADEIFVVDGGSQDETCTLACGAKVLRSNPGRAMQQNVGAQAATGDMLLFLHADCTLHVCALQQLRAACARKNVVWGAMRQRIDAGGARYRMLEAGNAWRVRWRGIAYGDQALWVRRDTFLSAGGFADVPLLEDLLLSRKLRRSAWPVLLPGPLMVSARRWQKHGVVRQTLRNWGILARHALGASPQQLAERYRRHDR